MTKRAIFSIQTDVPSRDIHKIRRGSNQTLLDADIVLFTPYLDVLLTDVIVEGKPQLSEERSFVEKKIRSHLQQEIVTAVNNGKLIIVYLSEPRSAVLTTESGYFDDEIASYDAVPCIKRLSATTGTKMKLTSAGSVIATYWDEFSQLSTYRVAIEGDFSEVLLQSEVADRIVGAITHGDKNGALLFLPQISFKNRELYNEETRTWTEAGLQAGKRFVSAIVALADTLATSGELTPAPDWTSDGKYRISSRLQNSDRFGAAQEHPS